MEEILGKYFAGEASEVEINQVNEWRSATETNSKAFFEYKKIWLATTPKEAPDQALLDEILEEDEAPFEVVPLWNQKLFRIAAALVVALGLVFLLLKNSQQPEYDQVVTEVTEYTLPDGSVATLQKGASISIGDFKDVRSVSLIGKAFFEVKKNDQKPFMVTTSGAVVKALGTSFVVHAPEGLNEAEVMVSSGKVSFAQNPKVFGKKAMKISLEQGEMGVIKSGEQGIRKQKIMDANYLAWKTKMLSFKKTSLADVSKTIEDVYGVSVEFEHPALRKCSLTAKFKDKSVDEVIEIIAKTFGITYVREGNKVLLRGETCQ